MIRVIAGSRPSTPHMWPSIGQRLGTARRLASSFWLPWHRGLRKAAASAAESLEAAELHFEAGHTEPILFPHLLEPGKRAVLVGVDPDIHGAVAVLSWQNSGASSSSSSTGGAGEASSSASSSGASGTDQGSSGSSAASLALAALDVTIHDIPTELWEQRTRSKRQPDGAALNAILREHLGRRGVGSEELVVGAVLEHTTPQHICGKYAWYGMGYSFGLLTGLLTSQGIPHHRVDASAWKRHLGLFRLGKEGSLALARQLFPQALPELKRKKDHGRAEALLIAAWALGVRMAPGKPPPICSGGGKGGNGVTDAVRSSGKAGEEAQTVENASEETEVEAAAAMAPGKQRRGRTARMPAAWSFSEEVEVTVAAAADASPQKKRGQAGRVAAGGDSSMEAEAAAEATTKQRRSRKKAAGAA